MSPHKKAALALLTSDPSLNRKTAGFLGQVCVDPVLSPKQREWLETLLRRNGLPPLSDGGGA